MMTALLIVIFLIFIGVGLPDSVLGTAWPAMQLDLGLPISFAGYITSAVSACTVVSSLFSSKLINRFGTGLVSAISTGMTALALLGYAVNQHALFLFLLAIPLGLGAGTIDTALNNFVATHYSASRMNFLHCFYGLGIAMSHYIMSLALENSGNWRKGYLIVALIQLALTAIAFLSLPLWKYARRKDLEEQAEECRSLSLIELLKLPAARASCLAFFTSCGLELCAGSWASSYFVSAQGLTADAAARSAMMFYVGLTLGRFLSGLLAPHLGRRRLLRICLLILLIAVLLFILPLTAGFCAGVLLLIGLGIGPVFPNLTHLTPDLFGKDISQSVMGAQQASSYVGVMTMPWLFGLLAQRFSAALLPAYLLALLMLYAASLLLLFRKANHTNKPMSII